MCARCWTPANWRWCRGPRYMCAMTGSTRTPRWLRSKNGSNRSPLPATLTRLVGHPMDWLFLDKPATYNLLEYEARLNQVLSKYDDPVICNYNPSKFGARVAMDIMQTHPLVIIGALLPENPFFIPPGQFLDEMHERRSAGKTAA